MIRNDSLGNTSEFVDSKMVNSTVEYWWINDYERTDLRNMSTKDIDL